MINAWSNSSAQPASPPPQTLGTSATPQPINIDAQSSFKPSGSSGMKKGFSPKMILSVLVLLLVVVGAGAGLYMTQLNQDLRQQAAETTYNTQCTQVLSDPPCSTITGCTWSSGKCVGVSTTFKCQSGWTDTGKDCTATGYFGKDVE